MLVINVHKGRWISLSGPGLIQIADVRGDTVRIAIDAPLATRVMRIDADKPPIQESKDAARD